jgi:hypothetical protein
MLNILLASHKNSMTEGYASVLGETATGSPEETLIHTHDDLTQGIVIAIDASYSCCEQYCHSSV